MDKDKLLIEELDATVEDGHTVGDTMEGRVDPCQARRPYIENGIRSTQGRLDLTSNVASYCVTRLPLCRINEWRALYQMTVRTNKIVI